MDKDNSIDDLIVYGSEENNEEADEIQEEVPSVDEVEGQEEISWEEEPEKELPDTELDEEEEEELDEYEEELEYDYEEADEEDYDEPQRKIKKRVILLIIAIVAVVGVIIYNSLDFFASYGENFRRNTARLFPALYVEEIPDEEIENDTTVVLEEDGNAVVYREYKEADISSDEQSDTNYIFNIKRTYMIPYESALDSSFATYYDGIICARTNNISYIDSQGKTQWERETSISSPILKTEGRYIVIAQKNGGKLALYKDSELLYDINTEYKIKSCNISASGDVVLVTEKEGYKGGVIVYNRYGKEIFVWSSGQNEVISADISSASRRVAVGLLNCDESVYSIIQIFDITKDEAGAAVRFDDTVIYDVGYTADIITGYGDNSMVCMTSTGRVIIDRRYDSVELAHTAHDKDGNKAYLFDNDNIPVIQTYNRKGTIKSEFTVPEIADYIDIQDNYILYNKGRDVLMRKTGSDRVSTYTATMDILGLHIINKNTFAIVHSNSLEIVVIG